MPPAPRAWEGAAAALDQSRALPPRLLARERENAAPFQHGYILRGSVPFHSSLRWGNTELERLGLCWGHGVVSLHSTVWAGRLVAVRSGRDGNWVRTAPELVGVKFHSWGGTGSLCTTTAHVSATNNVPQAWPEQPYTCPQGHRSSETIKPVKPRVSPEALASQGGVLKSPSAGVEPAPHSARRRSPQQGTQEHDLPSVLILRAVLTSAKSVALKVTVPSLFRGMFMHTRRCTANQQL